MKLLTGLFALTYGQRRPERPGGMAGGFGGGAGLITENDFQLVPQGYEGSFQGFNVTQMLDENKEDEIFQEFETLFQTVESGLGRSNYSEEQKNSIRKVDIVRLSFQPLTAFPSSNC